VVGVGVDVGAGAGVRAGAGAEEKGSSSSNRSTTGARTGAGVALAVRDSRGWVARCAGAGGGAVDVGVGLVDGVGAGGYLISAMNTPHNKSKLTAGACAELPFSRTAGSEGGGPSIAQRFDSYFDRINDSILLYHYQLTQPSPIKITD
jgi:hypothetical protein